MKIVFFLPVLVILSSCTEESPGLRQQLVEMQTRLAAKQAEVTELQGKLAAARMSAPEHDNKSLKNTVQVDDSVAVGAAADELARSLADELKPGQLLTSPKVAFAGLTLRTTVGSKGVAVPFFYNSAAGSWASGWSMQQIKEALQGTQSSAHVSTPAVMPQTTPTAAAPTSPSVAPMRLPRGWSYDAATGQVTASDGTVMPPLKNGERYGMIEGGAGETSRPVVVGADGNPKLIVR